MKKTLWLRDSVRDLRIHVKEVPTIEGVTLVHIVCKKDSAELANFDPHPAPRLGVLTPAHPTPNTGYPQRIYSAHAITAQHTIDLYRYHTHTVHTCRDNAHTYKSNVVN